MSDFASKLVSQIKAGEKGRFAPLKDEKAHETKIVCWKCNWTLVAVGFNQRGKTVLLVCQGCGDRKTVSMGMIVFVP